MPTSEKAMHFQEEHIPELAQAAVTQAYWQALAAGNSVLESDQGVIFEVFPGVCATVCAWAATPCLTTR